MISQYTPEQKVAKQLMFRLRCRKDGVLAESMQAKEQQGIAAWGVSILHIKEMSGPYFGNQELGFELLHQDMREARLCAAFIMDGRQLCEQSISDILPYLITTEMIEQFSMRVFPFIPGAESFFLTEMEKENDRLLFNRAALLSLGRMWRKTDNLTETDAGYRLALLLSKKINNAFQLEDQLAFAIDGILIHFPDMIRGLPIELQTECKKLTLLNYGAI